jgi:hypothetical protein
MLNCDAEQVHHALRVRCHWGAGQDGAAGWGPLSRDAVAGRVTTMPPPPPPPPPLADGGVRCGGRRYFPFNGSTVAELFDLIQTHVVEYPDAEWGGISQVRSGPQLRARLTGRAVLGCDARVS